MPLYVSNTRFNYSHPDSRTLIGKAPVKLAKDSWLDCQVAAGIISEQPAEDELPKAKAK